jgi:hypothetical protein
LLSAVAEHPHVKPRNNHARATLAQNVSWGGRFTAELLRDSDTNDTSSTKKPGKMPGFE